MSKLPEYAVRLALAFLNERYRKTFEPSAVDGAWTAHDPDAGDLSIVSVALSEASDAYREKAARLEARLDDTHPGSYLLWVPPGGELPEEEPDETEWIQRVTQTASKLASGRSAEVRLPRRMALAKVREEGGYASVTGGLGRYWTHISDKLNGSFYLDSRALNRFTTNEDERQQTYEHIALLSQELSVGEVTEWELDDAWTLQRLARGPAAKGMTDGWAIGGAPEGFDPADGGAIRRVLRKRLGEAKEAFAALPRPWILVLGGAYDYMGGENAGPSLRGFDPALVAALDGIVLVADGEVKPILLSRSLSFVQ
ncbi:MAG: hypothetical protein AB7P33_09025 [Dehalococcoidia bacterium]